MNNHRIRAAALFFVLCLVLIVVPAMAAAGLANSAWPKFGYDSRNSGHSPYLGSQTGTPKWEQQATNGFDNYVEQNPAIGPDGTFYVADYYGFLYAINPDGTTK